MNWNCLFLLSVRQLQSLCFFQVLGERALCYAVHGGHCEGHIFWSLNKKMGLIWICVACVTTMRWKEPLRMISEAGYFAAVLFIVVARWLISQGRVWINQTNGRNRTDVPERQVVQVFNLPLWGERRYRRLPNAASWWAFAKMTPTVIHSHWILVDMYYFLPSVGQPHRKASAAKDFTIIPKDLIIKHFSVSLTTQPYETCIC